MGSPERDSESDITSWLSKVAPEAVTDHAKLRRLLELLDRYQRERWNRHVSTGDSIVDRWERARSLGFGEGSSIYDSALIIGDVTVGRSTWIGPGTVLDGSGGLTIGDWCSISAGVQIYSHDSVLWAVTGGAAEPERSATSIGSNVYLGPNAVIAKGVKIGDRSIIGAMSLVLESIPEGRVVYGTPAHVVGSTDELVARREVRE